MTALLALAALPHPSAADSSPPAVAVDAPEVRQRAPFDCGPAGLQAVLRGFGIQVGYEELVKRCEVDPREGASIDTVEEVAKALGLQAEQVMFPVDHLFLPGNHRGPTLVILKGEGAFKHFLVLWRADGERVQTMDPTTGSRAWIDRKALLERIYVHEMAIPASAWREWSRSDDVRTTVAERMRRVGIPVPTIERLWTEALRDASGRGWQALDAAVRFVAERSDRSRAERDLQRLFTCSKSPSCTGSDRVPKPYWSAWPAGKDGNGEEQVKIRGAVALVFYGRAGAPN